MNKAKVLVLDVIGGKGFYEAECECLNDYYEHLKCETFDIATRKIGNKYFDIFVDDIGLFAENPIPSVVDTSLMPMLVGNCIFANHDSEGNTTSLSDDDIAIIKDEVIEIYIADDKDGYKAITAVVGTY